MKLEKGKVYKCWNDDGSYSLNFSDGNSLYNYNDFSLTGWMVSNFDKVEPYEPEAVDTLKEVVDWCEENGTNIAVTKSKSIVIGGKLSVIEPRKICDNQEQLLTHIRQEPKELTELKALAEKLGYELTKKD